MILLVGICGTCVVLARDPLRQALMTSLYGLVLGVLFFAFQAPDVALSQITVGSVALPAMILLAVARTRARAAREGSESRESADRGPQDQRSGAR